MENEKVVIQLATLIEQMKWMNKELHELRMDVKNLNAFKWKAIGVATIFGAIAGVMIEVFKKN